MHICLQIDIATAQHPCGVGKSTQYAISRGMFAFGILILESRYYNYLIRRCQIIYALTLITLTAQLQKKIKTFLLKGGSIILIESSIFYFKNSI